MGCKILRAKFIEDLSIDKVDVDKNLVKETYLDSI